MQKTILITGSTDGIGLEAAKSLLAQGHHVILHGRNPEKLERLVQELGTSNNLKGYIADLSDLNAVKGFADQILEDYQALDVLINNAGVLKSNTVTTVDQLDIRFAVNTFAPYVLTKKLLPLLSTSGRIINLSSAAQSPIDDAALCGKETGLDAMTAYSQSKLAITMWSFALSHKIDPMIVSINPGSLLASKMVKEGFGIEGKDITIGSDILVRAALSDDFKHASGQYFDNDSGHFSDPHPDALNLEKSNKLVSLMDQTLQMGI